jgi:hypothetical protein
MALLLGNHARFTNTVTALNNILARVHGWRVVEGYGVEDTTPVNSDYPEVTLNMREPIVVEVDVTLPDNVGVPAAGGAAGTLICYQDKNNIANNFISGSALFLGAVGGISGQAPGGKTSRARLRFIYNGAVTHKDGAGTTTTL